MALSRTFPSVFDAGEWLWASCKRRRISFASGDAADDGNSGGEAPQTAPRRQLIDINVATQEQLEKLPGVGPQRAKQILELRTAADGGVLRSLRSLSELPGVGAGSLEKIGRCAYIAPELGLHSANDGEDLDADLRRRCKKLLVGGWNVRNLGRNALETGRAKDAAKLIAEYDVIALLELRDTEVVEGEGGLLDMLGRDTWAATVSSQVGTDHHKENYGYLYRTASVKLLHSELLNDSKDQLVREPFMANFQASDGFDFVLAAVHIVWGKTVNERRDEVEALGKKLAQVKGWHGGERDVMLLGDFNLEPTDKGWDTTKEAGWMPLLEGEDLKSMVGDTHLYDNIWVSRSETATSEWLGASGVIRFDQVLDFGKGAAGTKKAIKELSDHRPSWALFATDVDDDEGTGEAMLNQ